MAAGPTRYLRFIQRRGPFIGIGILFGAVGKTIVDRLKGEVYIRHDEDSREHIVAEDVVFVGDEYGLPVGNDVLKYENHTICYDRSRKTPSWVLQRLNKNTINGDGERQLSAFKMDPNIPLRFSAFSDDYQKSGYSRGHMASAGDNRSSQKAMNETFHFTNIVPQDFKNNSGFWFQMERYCRKLTENYANVYVISGPLYLPAKENGEWFVKYKVIGSNEIAVPTHLFKVIMVEKDSVPFAVSAFVVPNAPISKGKQLSDFIYPLPLLEKKLGYELFPKVAKDTLQCLCKAENGILITDENTEMKLLTDNLSNARNVKSKIVDSVVK